MFHKKSVIRNAGLLFLALAVALSLSGCGKNKKDESGPDSLLDTSSKTESTETLSSESEGVEFEAELSYANYDYIDTGDESKGKLIRNVKQTLTASDSDEKLQIEAVLEALKKVPDNLSGAETFVSDVFSVNSLKFSGSTLIVDISSDGSDNSSMYDEQFFIYQVTDSVLNTFPDLEGVRFTVDGAKKDSLNYVDISSPFTASDVKDFLKGSSDNSSKKEESEAGNKSSDNASTKEDDSENETKKEGTQTTDSDSATKNSSTSQNSGTSGSQTSGSKNSSSSGSTSSGNNSTSGSQSSSGSSSSGNKNNGTSGSQSSSSNSSSQGSQSAGTSGSQSSSGSSSSSGNKNNGTSGNQNSSSGNKSNSSSGSSGSSSSTTQDGVVNDEDL